MPCHQECKYHGFLGLVEWCRHPENLGPLDTRLVEIEAAGGRCRFKVDWEAKVMPGQEPLADAGEPPGAFPSSGKMYKRTHWVQKR